MLRSGVRVGGAIGAVAAALLAVAGCARQDTAVVLMVVTVSGSLPDAVALNVTVTNPTLGGMSQQYGSVAGPALVFPTTLTAEIPGHATGMLTFNLTAQRADGSIAAGGQRTAAVPAGAAPTLYIQLTCAGKTGVCVPPAVGGTLDGGTNLQPNCGNGAIDPGETCDTAISAGQMGACPPADCDDGVACTKDEGRRNGLHAHLHAPPDHGAAPAGRLLPRRRDVRNGSRLLADVRQRAGGSGRDLRHRHPRRHAGRVPDQRRLQGRRALCGRSAAVRRDLLGHLPAHGDHDAHGGRRVLPGRRHQRGRSRLLVGLRRRCSRNRRDLRRRHPAPAARQLPGQLR